MGTKKKTQVNTYHFLVEDSQEDHRQIAIAKGKTLGEAVASVAKTLGLVHGGDDKLGYVMCAKDKPIEVAMQASENQRSGAYTKETGAFNYWCIFELPLVIGPIDPLQEVIEKLEISAYGYTSSVNNPNKNTDVKTMKKWFEASVENAVKAGVPGNVIRRVKDGVRRKLESGVTSPFKKLR